MDLKKKVQDLQKECDELVDCRDSAQRLERRCQEIEAEHIEARDQALDQQKAEWDAYVDKLEYLLVYYRIHDWEQQLGDVPTDNLREAIEELKLQHELEDAEAEGALDQIQEEQSYGNEESEHVIE